MQLSCCIWALSEVPGNALDHASEAGFKSIDIRPGFLDTEEQRARCRALELDVSCFGASFGLPDGSALDQEEMEVRKQAIAHIEKGIDAGANLGAATAYVVPEMSTDANALSRYADSLTDSANRAAALEMKLCVEHFPGRALPTAIGTVEYLRSINHPNLFLLLDLGHLQISNEDPASVIAAAGSLLGYVHLDDNDGKGDLPLPLLDGIMTMDTLHRTFRALQGSGYAGNVSLELNPSLDDPLEGLIRSRRVVEELVRR